MTERDRTPKGDDGASGAARAASRAPRSATHPRAGRSAQDPPIDGTTPAESTRDDAPGAGAAEAEAPGAPAVPRVPPEHAVPAPRKKGGPETEEGPSDPAETARGSTAAAISTGDAEREDGLPLPGRVAGPVDHRAARSNHRSAPLRERLTREVVGVAVLVVLALVCAALVAAVVAKTRDDAATAARDAAAYTPPPRASTSASAAAGGASVVVVADETALRSATGVDESERWPRLLADASGARVAVIASTGAGYVTAGADGRTFAQSAERVPSTADVILFVGGAADQQVPALTLARAATQAYSAASQRAPGASIVAIGPVVRASGDPEADLGTLRSALRSAARIADARWIDPIASNWVPGVQTTSALTAARERAVAVRVGEVVQAEVE